MSLPAYPRYINSGVEQLGGVPAHWELKRIKYVIRKLDQGWSPQCENFPAADGEWAVLKVGCVNGGIFNPEENKALPRGLLPVPELGIRVGDVLISRANTRELVGSTAVARNNFPRHMLCDKLYRLELNGQLCLPEYLAAYLCTPHARAEIELAATGASSSMVNIGQSTVTEMLMPIPDRREQSSIMNFLDRETGKIDALVEEQRRLIELLKEKRQAVISHAVTKGLNPDVPMKDSGVEWLGEVPEHWEVKPFRCCVDFQEGPGIMATDFRDFGIPLLRVSGVQGHIATLNGCNYLDPEKVAAKWKHFQLEEGDLLISASASMGTVCEIRSDTAGAVAYTGLIRLGGIPGETTRAFIRHVVVSNEFITQIDLLKAGATIQHFGPTHLRQMFIVKPPVEEQEVIATYVDREIARLDALANEANYAITLAQEHRKALISAAVTGKIDVRGLLEVSVA